MSTVTRNLDILLEEVNPLEIVDGDIIYIGRVLMAKFYGPFKADCTGIFSVIPYHKMGLGLGSSPIPVYRLIDTWGELKFYQLGQQGKLFNETMGC
jgi:hypothetical protein